MKQALIELYYRMQFHPGPLAVFFNPFFAARQGLAAHLRRIAPRLKGRVLDVGCGRKPYREFFANCSEYVGMEIDTPQTRAKGFADFFYDGKTFPFPSKSFDGVFASQVLEHVFNPTEFLGEIYRVLKPGGQIMLTVPFVWDEHEQPYDYARYSSFGLKHLLEQSGFQVLLQEKSLADVRVLFQLANAFIYKKAAVGNPLLRAFAIFFLMAPFNILGVVFHWILPGNKDLYLDNIALACIQDAVPEGAKP